MRSHCLHHPILLPPNPQPKLNHTHTTKPKSTTNLTRHHNNIIQPTQQNTMGNQDSTPLRPSTHPHNNQHHTKLSTPTNTQTITNYKKANWTGFKEEIKQALSNPIATDNVH